MHVLHRGHDMRDQHQLQFGGSLFLLRNPLAVASRTMRRGIRGFCHGVGSTSTEQQLIHSIDQDQQLGSSGDVNADAASSFLTVPSSVVGSCAAAESEVAGGVHRPAEEAAAVTLEQMILQLDLEEEAAAARKARRAAAATEEECYAGYHPRRMSCVNSSDHVLRSARDALSQYPRFSLDGRDAMCRASFSSYYEGMGLVAAVPRDNGANAPVDRVNAGQYRRASVCCAAGAGRHRRTRACGADDGYEMDLEQTLRMPTTVAGESVVWCKPGVVAKLMGLEAVPVPVVRGGRRSGLGGGRRKATGPPLTATAGGRKQRPRRMGKEELEKERLFMALHGYDVAGARACHAGALRATEGPNVSGFGRDGDGWDLRFPG